MSIFGKGRDEEIDDEEEILEERPSPKKIRDLAPENRRKRKEPVKPWGRTERIVVLIFLLLTILIPAGLGLSARNWKLPGLPKLSLPKLSFENEPIVIEGDDSDRRKTSQAKDYFLGATQELSGVYALYVIRLDDGSSYGVNHTQVMQAASLIKLPIMAMVYKKAEDGIIELDSKAPDSSSTYRQLLEAMGQRSDNSAQIKVVSALGEDKIQKYIDDLGMEDTSFKENLTTPKDIGLFFERLFKGLVIGEAGREEMLGFLTNTIYEDWIIKGIGKVRVAHKYGREVHVVNDAGIVYSNRPFVLVILSDGVVEGEADRVIPQIAAKIFEIETSR